MQGHHLEPCESLFHLLVPWHATVSLCTARAESKL